MNFRGGANTASAAGKHCADAAELHLSGTGIVKEAVDWVLVINDVAEGHYTSLAAALPFVPVGILQVARIERAGTREVLQAAMGAETTAAIQSLKNIENLEERLRVYGTVVDQGGVSETLAKILIGPGGPVSPPWWRGQLAYRMKKLQPRPSALHQAHHDLPWEFKDVFAQSGINVNDTIYGRWANKTDHNRWHNSMEPDFNNYWRNWFSSLQGQVPTRQEILNKLAEARSIYTQSQ